MSKGRHAETAFETVVDAHLLTSGYNTVDRDGFDREQAIFAETVLAFIREIQPARWAKLKALHGDKANELPEMVAWNYAVRLQPGGLDNGPVGWLHDAYPCQS